MKSYRSASLLGFVVLGAVVGLAVIPRLAQATPDSAAACIKVRAEARYLGLGYNHIVHLTDVCKSSAECDVTTDVNPQPTHASVPAGAHVEVNTFMGSPARVFTPKVDCKMQ